MKLIPLLLALTVSTAVTAKTTTLLCETKPLVIAGLARGSGNQANAQVTNQSTWRVAVESDHTGRVTGVKLDDEVKKFSQNGDLITFQAVVFSSLEINTQTLQARTTMTGYDTAEKGTCKVVSTTGAASATLPIATAAAMTTTTEPAPKKSFLTEQKAIVVNEIQTSSAEGFKEYLLQVRGTLQAFGGVILIKGGNGAATDGFKSVASVAVIEFPNRVKALQWYESAEYQKVLKSANANSAYRIFSVED